MTLDKELDLYGSQVTGADFNDILRELHKNMHPHLNTEQLLYETDAQHRFCEAVRARAGQGLPNNMILRRLQNIRKATRKKRAA